MFQKPYFKIPFKECAQFSNPCTSLLMVWSINLFSWVSNLGRTDFHSNIISLLYMTPGGLHTFPLWTDIVLKNLLLVGSASK